MTVVFTQIDLNNSSPRGGGDRAVRCGAKMMDCDLTLQWASENQDKMNPECGGRLRYSVIAFYERQLGLNVVAVVEVWC